MGAQTITWNSNTAPGINETTKDFTAGQQSFQKGGKCWPKYTAELEIIGMRSFWWKQKAEMLHVENTNKGLIVFNLVTWKCDLLTLDFWHCDHSVLFVRRPWRLGKALAMMWVDMCVGSVDIREWTKSKGKHQGGQRGQRKGWTRRILHTMSKTVGQTSLFFWAQEPQMWVLPFCSGGARWTLQPAPNSPAQPIIKKSIFKFLFWGYCQEQWQDSWQ